MKQLSIIIFSLFLLLSSCKEDIEEGMYQYSYDVSQTIYSETNETKLENISFIVSFFRTDLETDTMYLVVDKLQEIDLDINNSDWALLNTNEFDNEGIEYSEYENQKFTSRKISYLVVAGKTQNTPDTYTAGAFADYLNDFISLKPGHYVLEFASLKYQNLNNNTLTVKPRIYKDFILEEGVASLYLGEFNVAL